MPANARVFQIALVPEWIVKLLERVVEHEQFWINGVEFGRGDNWSYEAGRNIVYSPKITVFEKDFYNFTSVPELTGTLPVFTTRHKLIDSDNFTLINATQKTNIQ